MNRGRSVVVSAGVFAAGLGAAAGGAEIVVGTASWLGNKNDPETLGSVTVLLAVVMGAAGCAWPWATTTLRALSVAAGLGIPAVLGLTTAGAAWIPAGALATLGAVEALRRGVDRRALRRDLGQQWSPILLGFLALIYLALGLTTRDAGGALAVAGSLAIVAVLLLRHLSNPFVAVVLVLGAVPWAVVAWSSLVAPVTAVLALIVGLPLVLRPDRDTAAAASDR